MSDEFNDRRAFIASVILSGMLANRVYDPPRRNHINEFCEEAVNFADCLINKLQESK